MASPRCSYKKATALICIFNGFAAIYILISSSAPRESPQIPWNRRHVMGLSAQEVHRIQEAHDIRKKIEPHQLIERVKEIQLESDKEYNEPVATREKAALDIVQRLRDIQSSNNQSNVQALREWRRKKLQAARSRELPKEKNKNMTADMNHALAEEEVAKLVELGWLRANAEPPVPVEAGETLPTVNGPEVEDGIIPGRPVPPECHAEAHTDYDGAAVRWGLTHHTESAADCCQACFAQAKSAKPGEMKCNVWVFCASENGCYSPDIYDHKHQECWLKQSDPPKLNFKGHYHEEYRQSHPNTPLVVPWVSGVIKE